MTKNDNDSQTTQASILKKKRKKKVYVICLDVRQLSLS